MKKERLKLRRQGEVDKLRDGGWRRKEWAGTLSCLVASRWKRAMTAPSNSVPRPVFTVAGLGEAVGGGRKKGVELKRKNRKGEGEF